MTLDLTSALFLAPAPRVRLTGALTHGHPAVLCAPAEHRRAARALARAHGAADGLLARTSLHGLLDAIRPAAAGPAATVLLDEHVYPVGRWAAGAATTHLDGAAETIMTYRHLDAADAQHHARAVRHPVVIVTDGVCGSCLRPAPLADLASVVRRGGGRLVVDDTLAAGALGSRTAACGPFGAGGAGTAAWLAVPGDELVVVASLAKGYGVPLALLTGPPDVVGRVRPSGTARTHASPPTRADVAAVAALAPPDELARRRLRLTRLVEHTRTGAHRIGLTPLGIPLPVVHLSGSTRPTSLRDALARHGIRVLVTAGTCTGRAALTAACAPT